MYSISGRKRRRQWFLRVMDRNIRFRHQRRLHKYGSTKQILETKFSVNIGSTTAMLTMFPVLGSKWDHQIHCIYDTSLHVSVCRTKLVMEGELLSGYRRKEPFQGWCRCNTYRQDFALIQMRYKVSRTRHWSKPGMFAKSPQQQRRRESE